MDQAKTILNTKTKSPLSPFLPSPIQNSWKPLPLNVLILGRWDMGTFSSSIKFSFLFKFLRFNFVGIWFFIYRCKHYRRRCRIRAPCCNEVYSCRHCHNEATVFFCSFFLVFMLKILSFCFFLIWVCVIFFIFRACWKTLLIAMNLIVMMLNK